VYDRAAKGGASKSRDVLDGAWDVGSTRYALRPKRSSRRSFMSRQAEIHRKTSIHIFFRAKGALDVEVEKLGKRSLSGPITMDVLGLVTPGWRGYIRVRPG
jgi:hypothetical protein